MESKVRDFWQAMLLAIKILLILWAADSGISSFVYQNF
jgi:hypothetical protein